MLGKAVLALVLVVVALAIIRLAVNYPCHVQEGWSRVLPAGKAKEKGKARMLFMVARRAAAVGAKSFNYNRATQEYELFDDWLVNFTQPVDFDGDKIVAGPHVTGVMADPANPPPAPCCEKIKCEMRAFGLDPDGNMKRDWAAAGPYYDVAAAAKEWPKNKDGARLPEEGATDKAPFVDHTLTNALQEPGAKAPAGLNPDGSLRFAKPPKCGGSCDFCVPDGKGGCNPSAAFWHGCNARGQLFDTEARTSTYA
jgi:hypothetical protein